MTQTTYLRHLRLQFNIGLPELARKAGISAQQLNRLELRQVPCTREQEEKLCRAMEAWIVDGRGRLSEVEAEYFRCKGKLLTLMEENSNEL